MGVHRNYINIKLYADWLVHYFNLNGLHISPLKLQKILYYSQAWSLVFLDHSLFEDVPEAWANGPVYRAIWDEYKIKAQRHEKLVFENNYNLEAEYKKRTDSLNLDVNQSELLDSVLKKYSSYPSGYLVYLTHSELPWNEARKGCAPFDLCTIPMSLTTMKDYYKSLIEKSSPIVEAQI
jgi:uncharacterized phage-associated protein